MAERSVGSSSLRPSHDAEQQQQFVVAKIITITKVGNKVTMMMNDGCNLLKSKLMKGGSLLRFSDVWCAEYNKC